MRYAVELCRLYARFHRPVLLVGPVGSGKTTLARELHRAARQGGAFVSVSSGELIESLFADTLFGHAAGAYTGAVAARTGALGEAVDGTLLLDDLALMPKIVQASLLRVMESGRYRPLGAKEDKPATCRFLFASTVPPRDLVRDGRLLPDLESRLGELRVPVPSLRERRKDILGIARACAQSLLAEHRIPAAPVFTEETEQLLLAYSWPANVRELRAVVERAVMHAGATEGEVRIRPAHLPERIRKYELDREEKPELSADLVHSVLRRVGGNQSEAARRLGVHRNTIGRYMRTVG